MRTRRLWLLGCSFPFGLTPACSNGGSAIAEVEDPADAARPVADSGLTEVEDHADAARPAVEADSGSTRPTPSVDGGTRPSAPRDSGAGGTNDAAPGGRGGTPGDGVGAGGSSVDGERGGAADAGPAPSPPTACTLAANEETDAVGCFCDGALVAQGELLYRQSYGIEVFDVSTPSAPALLRTIEETGVSDGDVAIFEGWLVSAVNISPAVNVYSLEDPTTPTPAGSIGLPLAQDGYVTGTDLAVRGDLLAVAYWDGENTSAIQVLSISSEGFPAIERSFESDGHVRGMALGDGVAHVLTDLGANDAARQELRKIDLRDGSIVATFDTGEAGRWSNDVREWEGDSFLVGAAAAGLAVVEWMGGAGTVAGTWTSAGALAGRSLEFVGPGLVAIGEGSLDGRISILDVSDPRTPTSLGFVEVRRAEHLAAGDGVVYASGNDTLTAIALSCE